MNGIGDLLEEGGNADLTSLGSWLTRNRLRLHVLKSNYMIFGRLGLIHTLDLSFGGQAVTKSTLVKYLGIYIDPVLSFKAHIDGKYFFAIVLEGFLGFFFEVLECFLQIFCDVVTKRKVAVIFLESSIHLFKSTRYLEVI
jgi:hypothetical protein